MSSNKPKRTTHLPKVFKNDPIHSNITISLCDKYHRYVRRSELNPIECI